MASGISDAVGGLFDMDLGAATDYGAGGLGTGGYGDFAMDDLFGQHRADRRQHRGRRRRPQHLHGGAGVFADIAERDAINRFTTAEVRIDMTGMTNRIEGGADLDGVISTLTDGFTEALLTAAGRASMRRPCPMPETRSFFPMEKKEGDKMSYTCYLGGALWPTPRKSSR